MTPNASDHGAKLRARLADARLYLCTDARDESGDLVAFVRSALSGGLDIVQVRDRGISTHDEIAAVRAVAVAAREAGALVAVNDRADVAAITDADVLHVGQDDLSPAEARGIVGQDVIIGQSTHSLEQARRAADDSDVD